MRSFSVFGLEPLYIPHLEISKLVNEGTVSYLLSKRLRTGEVQCKLTSFVKISSWILRGCNLLLRDIDSDGELPQARIHFLEERHEIEMPECTRRLGCVRY